MRERGRCAAASIHNLLTRRISPCSPASIPAVLNARAGETGPIQLESHIFSESRVYILASKTSSMQAISREDLKQALDRHQVVLLDARSPEEFAKSHLPGAINVPAGRASELAPQLLPDKNALIVTYCVNFTWKLSEQLARELIALGYNR